MSSPAVKQEEWAKKEEQSAPTKEDILRAMNASTGEGPGRFIKQFRDLSGMSEMEAASRMTISLHQLRALEADDFAQLPAPIYVRSYLRRFSEVFSVPMSDLLASYERCESSREPSIARVSQNQRIHYRGVSTKSLIYGIGAVILIVSLWLAKMAGLDDWVKGVAINHGSTESSEVLAIPSQAPETADLEPITPPVE
ncbi:MAG: helix-turn-helix domain-containing protein [Gammaproteobacteria bacterium]|nr:helix-turn-helix domain-containing protein [Gammaproteobacteria bacterium]